MMISRNASSMGVGGPGHRASSCALTSANGCQISDGMTRGTPPLLAMAPLLAHSYFWLSQILSRHRGITWASRFGRCPPDEPRRPRLLKGRGFIITSKSYMALGNQTHAQLARIGITSQEQVNGASKEAITREVTSSAPLPVP